MQETSSLYHIRYNVRTGKTYCTQQHCAGITRSAQQFTEFLAAGCLQLLSRGSTCASTALEKVMLLLLLLLLLLSSRPTCKVVPRCLTPHRLRSSDTKELFVKPDLSCKPSINQSINQLHVFLAREEPKKGATPKPPSVIPNR
jgi:hypothetical protein